MKGIRLFFAMVASLMLAACATETTPTSTTTTTTTPAPYVVDPYPSPGSRCTDCGTIESVSERQIAGKINIPGAVAGAIIGGVVGHQFGEGRGQDAATAGGAVAGGVIGSQVGKEESTTVYDLGIRMDGGDYRTVTVAATGGLRVGSRVRIDGNRVVAM